MKILIYFNYALVCICYDGSSCFFLILVLIGIFVLVTGVKDVNVCLFGNVLLLVQRYCLLLLKFLPFQHVHHRQPPLRDHRLALVQKNVPVR